jgi:hypothetical protein
VNAFMLRPKNRIQISAKAANLLLEKGLISIERCGSILYREFEFTSPRQRSFSPDFGTFSSAKTPHLAAKSRILPKSENRFWRISRSRNADFLRWGESKSGFSPEVSLGFEIALCSV